MDTGRIEAFSDGVLAIVITIMVLGLVQPAAPTFESFFATTGLGLLSYLLSFVYVGIYWNNHHHMLHAAGKVSGGVLWANLHLLFWLSLVPFATGWMGENHFASWPTAVYGLVLLMASIAYLMLERVIIASEGPDSMLKHAVRGGVWKEGLSTTAYVVAIASTFFLPWVAQALYTLVALAWLVPDRRIERELGMRQHQP